MASLKRDIPGIRFSGIKVTPDEIDQTRQYSVNNPSTSATWYGTAASASAAAFGITNINADYPRNILVTIGGVAGGMGGTATVNGKDQFGNVIQETLGFATANGGGSVAGTKIFAQVTSGTCTPVGLGGTAVGTMSLGVAIGTAANLVALFGLPDKIGAVSDVKRMTFIDNGTAKNINGGTIAAYIGTANHTFRGTAIVAATDQYHLTVRSTFNPEESTVNTL